MRIVSPEHLPLSVTERLEAGKVREVEYRLSRRHYDPYEAVVRGERERKRGHRPYARDGGGADHPGHAGRHAQGDPVAPGRRPQPLRDRAARRARLRAERDRRLRGRRPDPAALPLRRPHLGRERRRGRGDRVLPGELREPVRARRSAARSSSAPASRSASGTARRRSTSSTVASRSRARSGRARRTRRSGAAGSTRCSRWRSRASTGRRRTISASRRATTTGRRSSPTRSSAARGASSRTDRTTSSSSSARRTAPDGRPSTSRPSSGGWARATGAAVGSATNDLVFAAGRDSFDVLSGGAFGLLTEVASITLRDRLAFKLSPTLTLEAGVDGLANRRLVLGVRAAGGVARGRERPVRVAAHHRRRDRRAAGGSPPRRGSRRTGARSRGCGSSTGLRVDAE